MNIRNATMADLDEVTRVESECFPAAEAASREELEQRLNAYSPAFLAAGGQRCLLRSCGWHDNRL